MPPTPPDRTAQPLRRPPSSCHRRQPGDPPIAAQSAAPLRPAPAGVDVPAAITVFVRAADPQCEALLRYLDQRGLEYTTRDVTTDPSATAILFGRLGRVAVPAPRTDYGMLVGLH